MIIQDLVYGRQEISEPVLIELINSKPIQRLKGINQYGPPKEYYHYDSFSRYDHSIGVMLLLKKLGAKIEEVIAGLLHDASHTAFSHVIDWVIGDSIKEDYQDKNHQRFINGSEIPFILKKYGLTTSKISELSNYPLLEREAPDLCADRVDYTFRELSKSWHQELIVKQCLDSLTVKDNQIMFNNKKQALSFAKAYLNCQVNHWGSPETVIRYHLLAKALKNALSDGTLVIEDFYVDDEHVINKIKKSTNPLVIEPLSKLSLKKINYSIDELKPEVSLKKKFRYVDPQYIESGKLVRLSSKDTEFKKLIEKERENNNKGIQVRIC